MSLNMTSPLSHITYSAHFALLFPRNHSHTIPGFRISRRGSLDLAWTLILSSFKAQGRSDMTGLDQMLCAAARLNTDVYKPGNRSHSGRSSRFTVCRNIFLSVWRKHEMVSRRSVRAVPQSRNRRNSCKFFSPMIYVRKQSAIRTSLAN